MKKRPLEEASAFIHEPGEAAINLTGFRRLCVMDVPLLAHSLCGEILKNGLVPIVWSWPAAEDRNYHPPGIDSPFCGIYLLT